MTIIAITEKFEGDFNAEMLFSRETIWSQN